MDYQKLEEALILWIQGKVQDANAKGVVFGLSGGVDSAVIAYLSKKAFGDNVLAMMIPIESDPKDEKDAMLVIEDLSLPYRRLDLSKTYASFLEATLEEKHLLAAANAKARLRMLSLYYYAQKYGYLVIGSSNRSEFMTGYFTKFGDSASDLLPLADIYKTEIWMLAKHLAVPEVIIHKKPTAGLLQGQTDEADFGFTYVELDRYLQGGQVDKKSKENIEHFIQTSDHKRNFPPIFSMKEHR